MEALLFRPIEADEWTRRIQAEAEPALGVSRRAQSRLHSTLHLFVLFTETPSVCKHSDPPRMADVKLPSGERG